MNDKFIYDTAENDPQQYYWFQEALTKEEVDKVIALASELPEAERATTIGDEKGGSVRSSMVKWIPRNNSNWDWLYERMMNLSVEANDTLWRFDLRTALEAIQYTEYYASENGHYDWHQDIGIGVLPSKRKVSITIQLSESDDYEGGELLICVGSNGNGELDNNRVCPRGKGVGVLFPSYMMHRVTPVTKGTRKSLVLWVGGGHYR
jgi:PKHD-type hydroxylase